MEVVEAEAVVGVAVLKTTMVTEPILNLRTLSRRASPFKLQTKQHLRPVLMIRMLHVRRTH